MSPNYAAVIAAFFLLWNTSIALAQDVVLTSRDGAVEISGNLLGFDGEFYRLETIYGKLTVDGSGVLCSGPGCPNLQGFVAKLAISGSSTMGEVLMPALVEAFARRRGYRFERKTENQANFTYVLTDVESGKTAGRFTFRVNNTDEGFADFLAGEADIVMALREIRPQERRRAKEAGMGDMTKANRSRVLALDAIVPLIAPENPVRAISTVNLAAVLSGKILNWSDLGGPDAAISLHLPIEGSGLSQSINDKLLRPMGLDLVTKLTRQPLSSALAQAVVSDPFALGIASYAETGNARVLPLTGECGFSLRVSRTSIKTEDYPLTSPMFLYFPAWRLPKLAREFLLFTRGPLAQVVIRRAGFVDQAVEEITIEQQGGRFSNAISVTEDENQMELLKRLVTTLTPMTRLTMSFRFEAGSIRLDAQSRSNVAQLAAQLERGQYDTRQILFVGFSDSEGPGAGNLALSRRRAEVVHKAVVSAAETADLKPGMLGVEAFGEAMPLACDDSSWGRQVNRRVEVWLR